MLLKTNVSDSIDQLHCIWSISDRVQLKKVCASKDSHLDDNWEIWQKNAEEIYLKTILTWSHGRKDMSGTEWVSELTMAIGR